LMFNVFCVLSAVSLLYMWETWFLVGKPFSAILTSSF